MNQGRYATDGSQTSTQPGSRGRVLTNLQGMVWVGDIQRAESTTLLAL